jgi:hypothetical protein
MANPSSTLQPFINPSLLCFLFLLLFGSIYSVIIIIIIIKYEGYEGYEGLKGCFSYSPKKKYFFFKNIFKKYCS